MSLRPSYPELQYGDYLFTANKQKLDLNYAYKLLCVPSQYSTGVPPERFALIIKNSLCFSVFYEGKQMGFARIITDYSEFATLWDVIIDETHRKKGLGKTLLKYVLEHTSLKGVFRWFLMTEDAHGLYQKFGFKSEVYNHYMMMRVNSG